MSTEVIVTERPECDVHKYEKQIAGVPAMYDAKDRRTGSWGFMCADCFKERGSGLGTGLGQRLTIK